MGTFNIKDALTSAADTATGQIIGLALGGIQDRRQIRQQKKLQELQIQGNKEMADYQQKLQLDMWNKTNAEAQVEHYKNAGLNTALMYGMGGGGGVTTGSGSGASVTGGNAGDPVAATGQAIQMGLMIAQKKVLDSQAKKNEAEAEKISGVDTKEGEARTAKTEFENKLNNTIGIDRMWRNYSWASDKLAIEFERENADWETYKATGYEGKTFDDETSPVAKAMKAGFEQKIEELKKAKIDNNIGRAEEIIKEFEADLTKQGIPANSPWGVKLIADMLEKTGIVEKIKK